jgi:protein phosphatase
MADNFLRRLFGRASKDTPVPGVRPTIELQTLRPLSVAGASSGAAGTSDKAVQELRVEIGSLSDVGCVREVNEDSIRVIQPTDPNELAKRGILVVVADGMGGHNAGAVASREVARHLACDGVRLTDAGTAAAALHAIDAALYRAMAADVNLLGMGTTVVGLALAPRLTWFNVGDSRLYRAGGSGCLAQLSVDDTPPAATGRAADRAARRRGGAAGAGAVSAVQRRAHRHARRRRHCGVP